MSDSVETNLSSILFRFFFEITIQEGKSKMEGAMNIDRIFGYSEIIN
jgi:hypothetical protein